MVRVELRKFFVVFAVPNAAADFETLGIFSRYSDASDMLQGLETNQEVMPESACVQSCTMPDILRRLSDTTLGALSKNFHKLQDLLDA